MKAIDSIRAAWFWPGVAMFLFTLCLWFCGWALILSMTGCEQEPYCVDGEVTCDEDEILICNGDGKWDTVVDCNQFEPVDNWENVQYTCCWIDDEIGCELEGICELYGQRG